MASLTYLYTNQSDKWPVIFSEGNRHIITSPAIAGIQTRIDTRLEHFGDLSSFSIDEDDHAKNTFAKKVSLTERK